MEGHRGMTACNIQYISDFKYEILVDLRGCFTSSLFNFINLEAEIFQILHSAYISGVVSAEDCMTLVLGYFSKIGIEKRIIFG